jgi:Mrp family chromosome partitioning ATPase
VSDVASPRPITSMPVARERRTDMLLPGELPRNVWGEPAVPQPMMTLDQAMMKSLAMKSLAAGEAGTVAVGIASLHHGDGATTIARALATCLAATFRKRVVLVEANQRSPSLRQLYGLPDGPGFSDVLTNLVPLGGALQIAGGHRGVLVLPASTLTMAANVGALALRTVLEALLGHADAVVVDLPPVLPYRDTGLLCAALDGVALVLRGGHAKVTESRMAIASLREAGVPVLGAILNREKPVLPRTLSGLLRGSRTRSLPIKPR